MLIFINMTHSTRSFSRSYAPKTNECCFLLHKIIMHTHFVHKNFVQFYLKETKICLSKKFWDKKNETTAPLNERHSLRDHHLQKFLR